MTQTTTIQTTETTVAVASTPAHFQSETQALAFYYPAHEPRETDPHYALFNHIHDMVVKHSVGCWICGTKENLEVHHAECEFAAAQGADIEKLKRLHPEYALTDRDSFLAWVEGEGNMQVLCARHHRAPGQGIHHVPYPNWKLQQFWDDTLPPPVQTITEMKQQTVQVQTTAPDPDTQ